MTREDPMNRCWLPVLVLIAALPSCRKGGDRADAMADAYRSPYIAIQPDAGPADSAKAATPVPTVEIQKPRVHPAARERDYPMKSLADLAQETGDRETLDLMSDPKRGVSALNRVKAAGLAGVVLTRKALACTNREVRMQAALVLGNVKDAKPETVKALTDAVLLDPDPDVRAVAAKAFVAIDAPAATPVLIRSLEQDPYEDARASAAWALGNVGGPAAFPALRKALKDEATWVRLRAASSLKRLKARVAVNDLVEALGDANPMVRERVREALKVLTGRDLGESQEAWKKVYK
jgi:hypothetical protein